MKSGIFTILVIIFILGICGCISEPDDSLDSGEFDSNNEYQLVELPLADEKFSWSGNFIFWNYSAKNGENDTCFMDVDDMEVQKVNSPFDIGILKHWSNYITYKIPSEEITDYESYYTILFDANTGENVNVSCPGEETLTYYSENGIPIRPGTLLEGGIFKLSEVKACSVEESKEILNRMIKIKNTANDPIQFVCVNKTAKSIHLEPDEEKEFAAGFLKTCKKYKWEIINDPQNPVFVESVCEKGGSSVLVNGSLKCIPPGHKLPYTERYDDYFYDPKTDYVFLVLWENETASIYYYNSSDPDSFPREIPDTIEYGSHEALSARFGEKCFKEEHYHHYRICKEGQSYLDFLNIKTGEIIRVWGDRINVEGDYPDILNEGSFYGLVPFSTTFPNGAQFYNPIVEISNDMAIIRDYDFKNCVPTKETYICDWETKYYLLKFNWREGRDK